MRTYYQQLKDKGLSVLMVTRMLKEANVLNRRGDNFPQRTLQSYFDSNFEAQTDALQEDMDVVLEKVELIIKGYTLTINSLKDE